MARRKKRDYKKLLQPLAVHDLLATIALFTLLITSIVLISNDPVNASTQTKLGLKLSLFSSRPKPAPRVQSHQKVIPQVLDESTQQPAPETWQGPIEPLPDNPSQPALPIVTRVPTTEPVVFLGIDDGWVQTHDEYSWLTQHYLPFSLFLTDNGINHNYPFFQQLQAAGMTIEDHTISHPDLTRLTLDQQKTEICGAADKYETIFGSRPTLFRPPYGKANQLTLQAASECGMKAVVMWHALIQNGAFQYQDGQTHLLPGDIVLMHFTNNFPADIQAFMNQIQADHLQVARMEDWLP